MSQPKSRQPMSKLLLDSFERSARVIRERVGLGQFEPFMPFEHLRELNISFRYLDEAKQLPENIRNISAKDFSGWATKLPDGGLFVILNRSQSQERMNVTLLEEVAHHYYDHPPTLIGKNGRTEYSPADEQEAQGTAAALLLPAKIVAQSVYRQEEGRLVAAKFGASEELYEQRVKVLGLWDYHTPFQLQDVAA